MWTEAWGAALKKLPFYFCQSLVIIMFYRLHLKQFSLFVSVSFLWIVECVSSFPLRHSHLRTTGHEMQIKLPVTDWLMFGCNGNQAVSFQPLLYLNGCHQKPMVGSMRTLSTPHSLTFFGHICLSATQHKVHFIG